MWLDAKLCDKYSVSMKGRMHDDDNDGVACCFSKQHNA